MTGDTEKGFSIIVCTHNGAQRLEPTLKHIAALHIPDSFCMELIVVDNASTDNTGQFSKEVWNATGAPFPLVIIDEKRPGKGYAAEVGYDAAKYSYILTVDDDNWLDKNYLTLALALFENDPSIGILQGNSTGVFEEEPPVWVDELKEFFIIGGPKKEEGYFPEFDFYVWGAGMVIKKEDWNHIRSIGFSALTSKLPGKAAGEDNEVAIALMLLGRKIYYSKKLKFQHFMPAGRVNWEKLKQNFDTFAYVNHYFFLYTLVVDAYKKSYIITKSLIRRKFINFVFHRFKQNTLKQHLAFWFKPNRQYYQLIIGLNYSHIKWFYRLSKNASADIDFIQSWMLPLLRKNPKSLNWVYKLTEG